MSFSPGGFGGSPGLDHGQLLTAEEQGRARDAELASRGGDPGHRPPKRPSLLRRLLNRIRRRRGGEA